MTCLAFTPRLSFVQPFRLVLQKLAHDQSDVIGNDVTPTKTAPLDIDQIQGGESGHGKP